MSRIKKFVENRKAYFEYNILEKYEAGIVLHGNEVKSIKSFKSNISGSYVKVLNNEIFIINMKVAKYEFSIKPLEEDRTKKLLLARNQINKLLGSVQRKGLSIIPLEVYSKNGFIKILIALAEGKKLHDKRRSLTEKAKKRDAERETKYKIK